MVVDLTKMPNMLVCLTSTLLIAFISPFLVAPSTGQLPSATIPIMLVAGYFAYFG